MSLFSKPIVEVAPQQHGAKQRLRELMHSRCLIRKEGFGNLRHDLQTNDDVLRRFCEGADNLNDDALNVLTMYYLNAKYDAELDAFRSNSQPATSMGVKPQFDPGAARYPPVMTHVGPPPAQPREGVVGDVVPRYVKGKGWA